MLQQDMDSSLVEIYPTQDRDVSSSLVQRANGCDASRLNDWAKDDCANGAQMWMENFRIDTIEAVGQRSYHILRRLMDVYLRHIPKDLIVDHNLYLDKMSEIIVIYMETEIRASGTADIDSSMQISAKLLAVLYIYLDYSEEHVLRVLLRTKFLNSKYSKIYRSIFRKCCTRLDRSTETISTITYVRYLLVLKLWKKTCDDATERKQIDDFALKILGPRVPDRGIDAFKFFEFMRKNGDTMRLMKQNSFDLRAACDDFVELERQINEAGTTPGDAIEYNL